MTVTDTFAAAGIVLPLSYDGDGTLIDANDTVACQVDPNCEMDDDRVAAIAAAFMGAANAAASQTANGITGYSLDTATCCLTLRFGTYEQANAFYVGICAGHQVPE